MQPAVLQHAKLMLLLPLPHPMPLSLQAPLLLAPAFLLLRPTQAFTASASAKPGTTTPAPCCHPLTATANQPIPHRQL